MGGRTGVGGSAGAGGAPATTLPPSRDSPGEGLWSWRGSAGRRKTGSAGWVPRTSARICSTLGGSGRVGSTRLALELITGGPHARGLVLGQGGRMRGLGTDSPPPCCPSDRHTDLLLPSPRQATPPSLSPPERQTDRQTPSLPLPHRPISPTPRQTDRPPRCPGTDSSPLVACETDRRTDSPPPGRTDPLLGPRTGQTDPSTPPLGRTNRQTARPTHTHFIHPRTDKQKDRSRPCPSGRTEPPPSPSGQTDRRPPPRPSGQTKPRPPGQTDRPPPPPVTPHGRTDPAPHPPPSSQPP